MSHSKAMSTARNKLVSDLKGLTLDELPISPSPRDLDAVSQDLSAVGRIIGRYVEAVAEELRLNGCSQIAPTHERACIEEYFAELAQPVDERADDLAEHEPAPMRMEAW